MFLTLIYLSPNGQQFKLSIRRASDPSVELYESKYAYDCKKSLDVVCLEARSGPDTTTSSQNP